MVAAMRWRLGVLTLVCVLAVATASRLQAHVGEQEQDQEYPVVGWNNWSKEVWRPHAKYMLAESPIYFSHGMDIMDPFVKNVDPRTMAGGWKPQSKKAQYYTKIGGTGQHAGAHLPWKHITPALLEVKAPADDLPVECVNCEFRDIGE